MSNENKYVPPILETLNQLLVFNHRSQLKYNTILLDERSYKRASNISWEGAKGDFPIKEMFKERGIDIVSVENDNPFIGLEDR